MASYKSTGTPARLSTSAAINPAGPPPITATLGGECFPSVIRRLSLLHPHQRSTSALFSSRQPLPGMSPGHGTLVRAQVHGWDGSNGANCTKKVKGVGSLFGATV